MSAVPGSVNRASKFRGADDYYPTPAGATWALCRLGVLPRRVWEPACGGGAMSRVLQAAGHDVVSTTLTPRGFGETDVDFLECKTLRAPAIVTNPPFNLADQFVAHALALGADMTAFFLRLKYLEGRKRFELVYRQHPPAAVYVFIERVKFFAGDVAKADQPGWNTEAFAWFIWRAGHVGPPILGWLSRDNNEGVFA